MQILFAPATVTANEWAEIQATVASLRGDDFAYGDSAPNETPAPAAPVAATATTAPAAPPPASEQLLQAAAAAKVAGVDIDKNGIPWDARIHSKPAVKTAKGEWRKKRGIDDALVDAVTAELKQVMAAPSPATEAETPPAPAAPVAPPPPETPAAPIAVEGAAQPTIAVEGNPAPAPVGASPETTPVATAPVPAPPVAETMPADASMASGVGPVATAPNTFPAFMQNIVAKQAAGLLTQERTTEIAQLLGLTGIKDLAVRQDLIPAFEALLD